MGSPPREISTDGRIVPLARLGVGGMGEVLLAQRTGAHGFEKLIAVKTIRADRAQHDDARRMFTDEARLLARLDHPAIAQVYDLGEQDGILYLTMEYVPGIALGTFLSRRKAPLPPEIAAQIVAAAARGLHAAHELSDHDGHSLGVVHRDISPQNIMLTFDGRVKVLDFGVAWMRNREAQSTDTGAVKGKLSYLAPEQIRSEPVDRRTDVYALSIVLWELLTARRLFGGDGSSLAAALRRPRVGKPSSREKAVSAELDQIVMRGLDSDPAGRWPDARSLALALEEEAHRLGGETLEIFALRELATLAQENKAFLRKVRAAPEAVTLKDQPLGGTVALESKDMISTGLPAARGRPWALAVALMLGALGAVLAIALRETGVQELWSLSSSSPNAPRPAAPPSLGPVADLEALSSTRAPTSTESVAFLGGSLPAVDASTATVPAAAPEPSPELSPDAPSLGAEATATEEADDVEPEAEEPPPNPAPLAKGEPSLEPGRPKALSEAIAPAGGFTPPITGPNPAPPVRLGPRPTVISRGFGSLSLVARAGGVVYVDGKKAGATPLYKHRLKIGHHTVALVRPGDQRPRWQAQATIHENRHLRIELR